MAGAAHRALGLAQGATQVIWRAEFIEEEDARAAGLPGRGWYPVNERGEAHSFRYPRRELCEAWIRGVIPVYREAEVKGAS